MSDCRGELDTTMTFQIRVRRKEMADSRGKEAGIIPVHLERRYHADVAAFPSKRVNVPVEWETCGYSRGIKMRQLRF